MSLSLAKLKTGPGLAGTTVGSHALTLPINLRRNGAAVTLAALARHRRGIA
jgi:hypothetical protein